jgi:cytidylate kinase
MAIVTIFSGTFGDDEELAKNVAQSLDCRYLGRDILVDAARRCEVPEAKLNDILEKEPHWWERWQENLRPYRIALQAAMSEAALADNLVYHGHVGHGLLPGMRHVLRVLLTAPMEFRIKQVSARQGLDANAARHYIEHVEKARTRRLMALFGTDWHDPGQYTFILNMAQMSPKTAVKIIVQAAQLDDYQPTAESRQALENLALSSRVEAHLLTYPRLRDLPISVCAMQGEISLSAIVPKPISEIEIVDVVKKVPGVKKVLADIVVLPGRVSPAGYRQVDNDLS